MRGGQRIGSGAQRALCRGHIEAIEVVAKGSTIKEWSEAFIIPAFQPAVGVLDAALNIVF